MIDRYRPALTTAVAAAQAAAALLHAEFHRTGGPRGQGDHADVDAQAEQGIRAALLDRFPTWGYLGEELGATPGRDPEHHLWLVDPHDGTRAFLQGFRGSTVAIGLLRDAIPVLGVVLAYAPAGGTPELFAWAEGCGPITRNGVAITRPAFAGELRAEQTILVSQAADTSEHTSRANAELCWPARPRALASLAHRLARVAAGEAEVAVSLHGPSAWDFAAGHALLRAVGGELFDERGQVIRYDREGSTRVQHAFGGAASLALELAGRDWSRVHDREPRPTPAFDLRRPVSGQAIADAGVLGRARGCLFGQLTGDALGSLVEFADAGAIARMVPDGVRRLADGGAFDTIAGQPTDDSELALMLARSLLAERRFDDEAIARAYAAWCASGPFDIGATTSNALRPAIVAFEAGRSAAEAARTAAAARNMASQANGALMRVSPLGIFGWRTPVCDLAELARREASLSHPNPVCLDASALFVVMIAVAIGIGLSPRDLHAFACNWAKQNNLHPDILMVLRESIEGPPAEYQSQMGWLRIALGNALFQLLHASDFEAGIVDTVMRGGDTDTNAAIAGALLGAVHGCDAIPRQWRDRVETCRPIAGLAGVNQPRPRGLWPVDAELLAEHLLLAAG
jgi:ADP-ribosylglycohydrolase/fructose-1,6-bisphosphatase/inositol monophosphatase family enzyme